jgi:serine/threonine protein kinase
MPADSSDVPETVETTGIATETPRPVSSLEVGSAETLPVSTGRVALADRRVGRFTITGLLGRGGMGEVYEAHDPELDRKVAIKLLRPEMSTQKADARLRREARSMAKLSHRNLVTVHDVGVHDGQLFVAMELIAGNTLRGWQQGKPWREIVAAYVAAGRGLASAHDAGIVHRDFKPDNVLVGKDGRAAVGDFGLAMSASDDAPDPARRRNRIVVAAAVGTFAAAVGATWYLSAPAADPCRDAGAAMTGVWKPGSVQRLRDAFAITHRANAEEAATRTAALLDRRAAAWTLEKVASCSATAHGNQSAEIDRRRALSRCAARRDVRVRHRADARTDRRDGRSGAARRERTAGHQGCAPMSTRCSSGPRHRRRRRARSRSSSSTSRARIRSSGSATRRRSPSCPRCASGRRPSTGRLRSRRSTP